LFLDEKLKRGLRGVTEEQANKAKQREKERKRRERERKRKRDEICFESK
jgi:hypothetical protein